MESITQHSTTFAESLSIGNNYRPLQELAHVTAGILLYRAIYAMIKTFSVILFEIEYCCNRRIVEEIRVL
jgi:hypothetical protein